MQHTLDAIKPLPVLEKPDSQPTLKSSAKPWTPLSLAKHLESTAPLQVFKGPKKFLITELQDVSCLCWREGALPCFVMKSLHTPAQMVYQKLQCEPIGHVHTEHDSFPLAAAETYEAKAATQHNLH